MPPNTGRIFNYDLFRRINIGDIDIFVGSESPNIVLLAADHRSHPAKRCRAGFIHEFTTLLHKLQPGREIERACRRVRSHFPERQASRTIDWKIAKQFADDSQCRQ